LRGAGRFKLGRALALAMTALPNEVGSAVFAMADLLHLLDDELSHIMPRRVMHRIWTYDAIKRYYLRMGFVATSALQL
jgi:hypothetical protein